MRTKDNKYLKSCYLHIKCFLANSLAALMWRWCLNSKQAALQLVVEGSGMCEMGQGEAPKTWFTVYSENGTKIIVYNMKMYPMKGDGKKQRKRKFKKYNGKRKNSILWIILFWLSRGWFLYLVRITILPKHSQPLSFS